MGPFIGLWICGPLDSTSTLHEVLSVDFNVCIFNLAEICVKSPVLK